MAYVSGKKATQSTSDDTPVNIDVPIATGAYQVGIIASSADSRRIWLAYAGFKLIAGTATLLSAYASLLDGVGDAPLSTATINITASAGSMRITLTGIAATDIDWEIDVKQIL